MTVDGVNGVADDGDDEIRRHSSSELRGKMSRDTSLDTDVQDTNTDLGTDDVVSQLSTEEDMTTRLNQVMHAAVHVIITYNHNVVYIIRHITDM